MCIGISVVVGAGIGCDDHVPGVDPYLGDHQLYARNGTAPAANQPRWIVDVVGGTGAGNGVGRESRAGREDSRPPALGVAIREVIPIYII